MTLRHPIMDPNTSPIFTTAAGAPVSENTNILTAGPRGPALLQDVWILKDNLS